MELAQSELYAKSSKSKPNFESYEGVDLGQIDQIIFYLSEGDLSKYSAIASSEYETAMAFFVMKKIQDLNELLQIATD